MTHTDFSVIGQIIPTTRARTSNIFELVRVEREIISVGAIQMGVENARVKAMVRRLVEQHWPKFESAGHRQVRGDRGGFYGNFEQDMEGIVRQVMKPLDASYENLSNAQYNLSRFPYQFAKWMAPIARKTPAPTEIIVDGGW